ncbi:unnamed protein product [Oikopleura dioica]|uniref:RRM domain-containing protein n=1 Tax=Oikopleura dioica TaxID=34765 RepID=E4X387_OIKDI|nr:unnamed protein product [Oikopleura dioica]
MSGASGATYFGQPALYGLMKKVELPEKDDRELKSSETAGELPTVGGLSTWIAVNAFGEVLAGLAAPLDNVFPSNLTPISRQEHESILLARTFAMECSLQHAKKKQKEKEKALQMQQIARQRAVHLMCRIYVGAVNYEVGEATVKTSFETFGPVRSVDMIYDINTGRHKGFAFVEFETPEAAHLACEDMQGATVGGRSVKVGRTSNMGMAEHFISQFAQEAARYNRIYVASVHENLSDDDIRAVFEAFGRVVSCSLVRDVSEPETHCGYGYIEFENPESMDEAVKAMDQYDLGGKMLRVCACVVPPSLQNITTSNNKDLKDEDKMKPAMMLSEMIKRTEALGRMLPDAEGSSAPMDTQQKAIAGPKGSAATEKSITSSSIEADAQNVTLSGQDQRNFLMNKLSRAPQTRVLVLRNMLKSDELDGEVEAEVTEECENYGKVTKVVIYQEKQSADENAEIIVKIFVQFSLPQEVQTAISALDKRWFNGNQISAQIYDQTAFDMKDYTG